MRRAEILITSQIGPVGSVNRLGEGCETKREIQERCMDHRLRKWNNRFPRAKVGKTGKEEVGEKEWMSAHIKLKMPSKNPSGDGPGGSWR